MNIHFRLLHSGEVMFCICLLMKWLMIFFIFLVSVPIWQFITHRNQKLQKMAMRTSSFSFWQCSCSCLCFITKAFNWPQIFQDWSQVFVSCWHCLESLNFCNYLRFYPIFHLSYMGLILYNQDSISSSICSFQAQFNSDIRTLSYHYKIVHFHLPFKLKLTNQCIFLSYKLLIFNYSCF